MRYRRLARALFCISKIGEGGGKGGEAVAAIGAYIDDILGCGEPDLSLKVRRFPESRPGKLTVQETSCLHVGMELGL